MSKPHRQPAAVDREFQLWRLLDHAGFMIGRAREKELSQFGLTPEQAHVLDILVNNGGAVTINDIVKITQRQHHSISTLVARMGRQGLITKEKNAEDLRKWDVFITPRGEELFRELTRDSLTRIMAVLTAKEHNNLRDGLFKLLQRAYAELGQTPLPAYKKQRERPEAGE